MKTLIFFFIALIQLFYYTEEKNIDSNQKIDTKCCEHSVEIKDEYLEGGFEYKKHYRILGNRDSEKNGTSRTVFSFVSEGNEEIKFITELRYDSIKDMSVRMANHWEDLEKGKINKKIKYEVYELPAQIEIINNKRSETKFQIIKKGLYFIHFYGKNQKSHCGSSASLIRKKSKKEIEKSENEPNTELDKNKVQEKE